MDQLNLTGFAVDKTGGVTARSFAASNPNRKYVTKTANYQAVGNEGLIAYTALTAARTVTLPLANTVKDGDEVELADWANNAGTYNLNAAVTSPDTLVGPSAINTNGGSMRLVSNGVDKWFSRK